MNKRKTLPRFWFNDRALYRQWPFWGGLAITLLPLLFAAWRILSPYDFDTSPRSVLFFFERLEPLIPWFVAVIAVAALLARMHATVQTKAQIDASQSDSTFGNYLKHREYVREGIRTSTVYLLRESSVDFQNLYKSLFPFNGFDRVDLSGGPLNRSDDIFDSFLTRICQEINHGYAYARRNSASSWMFNYDPLYQSLLASLGELGIVTPGNLRDFPEEDGLFFMEGIVTCDQMVDLATFFTDCLKELMQLSQRGHPSWLTQLVVFTYALRADGGRISEDLWERIAPDFCK